MRVSGLEDLFDKDILLIIKDELSETKEFVLVKEMFRVLSYNTLTSTVEKIRIIDKDRVEVLIWQ